MLMAVLKNDFDQSFHVVANILEVSHDSKWFKCLRLYINESFEMGIVGIKSIDILML